MKKIVSLILAQRGFKLVKKNKFSSKIRFRLNEFEYDMLLPSANYAPWLDDEAFKKVYAQIKENTLVDIYRCYELWELAETVYKLDTAAGFLEIGIWRGGTAGIVGKKLALLNADCPFYLADTFTGVAKATENDKFYKGGEHADTSQEMVESLLKGNYSHYKILKGIFPDETGQYVPDGEKFGFCHIDVDVYKSAKDIVDWIWNKLIIGGVIIFDDYGFHTCDGITKYVNEQKKLNDRMVVYNLNGHALMIKLK